MLMPTPNLRLRPVFKTAAIDDQEKFRPLPQPIGPYPYHLDIKQVLPAINADKMVFHLCGDTGGLTQPGFNHQVASAMIKQFGDYKNDNDVPQFFFHLGDVVYNYGQAAQFEPQFFSAYKHYPAPVFAIAGNHDADIDPLDPNKPQSLDAFMKVFCTTQTELIPFAGDNNRKSNIQPNIYYTLKTPLADFICLYSNVPRFGTITPIQKQWFIDELKDKTRNRDQKALIVCLHHSAYSADTNHGSSLPMQLFLNSAFDEAGVLPDVVFSGHVHNYQRFNKQYPGGKTVPFIVSGAGGYAELHAIAPLNDLLFPDTSNMLDNVTLQKSCDNTHGFLKIALQKTTDSFTLTGQYYTIAHNADNNSHASLYDTFTINLKDKNR